MQDRVCDHAYVSLTVILGWDSGVMPAELPRAFSGNTSYESRDKAIDAFKKWWTAQGEKIRQNKESLASRSPGITEKVRALKSANAVEK